MDHSSPSEADVREEAPTPPAKPAIDWKQLFERLPVLLIVAGWLAYAASYAGQASFLWGMGFTPEQAGLNPGAALIRMTVGVIIIILVLGLTVVMSYVAIHLTVSREGIVSRISRFWRIVAVALTLFVAPILPYFTDDPGVVVFRKLSAFAFGYFWAAGLIALAILAGMRGRRFFVVVLAVTAYGIAALQVAENSDAAAQAVRRACSSTIGTILVGFNPEPVQVTWAKATDAPASVRSAASKDPTASPGALIAGMLLVTDNGQQYLLYSCVTKRSYTVEHSTVSMEAVVGN